MRFPIRPTHHRKVRGCMAEVRRRLGAWALLPPVFLALMTVMFHAAPAHGQSSGGAGVLTGMVVDAADKKPAKDTVVTATSPALQGEQVVVTDGTGYYRIPGLPAGPYTLLFEKDGYRSFTRGGIELRTEITLRVNAELLPTTLKADEVVAVVKAPTVDVGSSTVGATISQDFTRRVPTAAPTSKGSANRSFEAVAEVAPGATSDTYGTSIAGTSSPENGYLIDGLSVGNPGFGTIGTPLSTEFIEETNVITGGYMPEYGRTTGGVLSAITKSGSNEFHGGAFSYWSPGGLSQAPKLVAETIDTQRINTPMAFTYDIGADVGGPIIKDKLWFYVGFDYSTEAYNVNETYFHELYSANTPGNVVLDAHGNPVVQQITGMNQNYQAIAQTYQAIGKLTYAINANNKLTATFIMSPTTTGGPGKFAVDPLAGGPEVGGGTNGTYSALASNLSSGAYDTNLKWSAEADNKRILVDTMAGWHTQYNNILPSDGSLPGSGRGLSAYPNVNWNADGTGGVPIHNLNQFEPVPGGACTGPNNTNLCPVPSFSSGGPQGQIARQSFNRFVLGSTLTRCLLRGPRATRREGRHQRGIYDVRSHQGAQRRNEHPRERVRAAVGCRALWSPRRPR